MLVRERGVSLEITRGLCSTLKPGHTATHASASSVLPPILPSPSDPGPVDAAYKAIDSLVRVEAELLDYSVNSVSEGIESLATTRVLIQPAGKLAGTATSISPQLGKAVMRSFSGEEEAICLLCCRCDDHAELAAVWGGFGAGAYVEYE